MPKFFFGSLLVVCFLITNVDSALLANSTKTWWEFPDSCFEPQIVYNSSINHPCYCPLSRPSCRCSAYWQALEDRIGELRIEEYLDNFLKTYLPCLFEFNQKYHGGLLWEEIVKQGVHDPIVQAILDGDVHMLESFLGQPLDLNKQLELTSLDIKVDYVTIAFIREFIDNSFAYRYTMLRLLLAAGADPSSALLFGVHKLPLAFLLILLDAPEALAILLEYGAEIRSFSLEGKKLTDIIGAFEDEFGCDIIGELRNLSLFTTGDIL